MVRETRRGRLRTTLLLVGPVLALVAQLGMAWNQSGVASADTTLRYDYGTRGDWQGVYGSSGHLVVGDPNVQLPEGVTVDATGNVFVWDADPTDPRALQRSTGGGRVAAVRYGSQFDVTLNLPADTEGYRLAVYILDYDTDNTRAQRMTLHDAEGTVLSTTDEARFTNGRYLLWNIHGSVRLTVERTAGANAGISGIFLDPLGTPDPPGDDEAPVVEASVVGSQTSDGSYASWARVTLAARDGAGAGVDKVEYAVDDGSWTTYEGPVFLRDPAEHSVAYRATDFAGNTSDTQSTTVRVVNGEPDRVPVRLIGINDYHGAASAGARMATTVQRLRGEQPDAALLGAGDLLGWTSYGDDATRDEFIVDLLEYMHMDANGAGNHEFDEGVRELQRIQNGGCHQVDGCFDHDGDGVIGSAEYDGAAFPFLVANLTNKRTGDQVFPGSTVLDVGGVRIGVIGVTNKDTAAGIGIELFPDYEFGDEARAINREAAKLAKRGVRAIVALVHQGGTATTGDCPTRSGPIFDIVDRIDPKVDAVFSGHWHTTYSCMLSDPDGSPRPVLSGASAGTQLQLADLVVDRATGEVDRDLTIGAIRDIPADIPRDPGAQQIIDRATAIANARGEEVVGEITGDFLRGRNTSGQLDPRQPSALLNLHADAELAWVRRHVRGGADFALADHVLVYGDLLYNPASGEGEPGLVRWRETWSANIYDARMLVLTMTGRKIERVLRSQWEENLLMGVSHNVRYDWDPSGETIPGRMSANRFYLDGRPLNPDRNYRVVVNSIIARGYDMMFEFATVTRRLDTGVSVRTAHNWHLGEQSPLDPADYTDRINILTSE